MFRGTGLHRSGYGAGTTAATTSGGGASGGGRRGGGGGSGSGPRIPAWICAVPLVFFGGACLLAYLLLTLAVEIGGPGGGGNHAVAAAARPMAAADGGLPPLSIGAVADDRSALQVALDAARDAAAVAADTQAAAAARERAGVADRLRARIPAAAAADTGTMAQPNGGGRAAAAGKARADAVGHSSSSSERTSSLAFLVPVVRHALHQLAVTGHDAAAADGGSGVGVSSSSQLSSWRRTVQHEHWPASLPRDVTLYAAGAPHFTQLFLRDLLVSGLLLTDTTRAATTPGILRVRAQPTRSHPSSSRVGGTTTVHVAGATTASTASTAFAAAFAAGTRAAAASASASEASRLGLDLLRAAVALGAATQGHTHDRVTGEEPGKIRHQLPDAAGVRPGDALRTAFAGADTTAVWLIAVTRVWLLLRGDDADTDAAADATGPGANAHTPAAAAAADADAFVRHHEAAIERALAYVDAHVSGNADDAAGPTAGLFEERPPPGAQGYGLRVTYWKDSLLFDRLGEVASARTGRVRRGDGAPRYPVTYTVVHAAYIKAVRSALLLPLQLWHRPDDDADDHLATGSARTANAARRHWTQTLQRMRRALRAHLFNWSSPPPVHAAGAASHAGELDAHAGDAHAITTPTATTTTTATRVGFLRVGVDARGVLRGLTSDSLHALWFLDPTDTTTTTATAAAHAATTAAAVYDACDNDGPDLSAEEVAAIEHSAHRLETAIGYRARFVRPPPHRHGRKTKARAAGTRRTASTTASKEAATAAAAAAEEAIVGRGDASLDGLIARADAADAEADAAADDAAAADSANGNGSDHDHNAALPAEHLESAADVDDHAKARVDARRARRRWHPREYHGNSVWPFEQAVIHSAATAWHLKTVRHVSGRMRHALHALHKRLLRHAREQQQQQTAAAPSQQRQQQQAEAPFFPEFFRPEDNSPDRERWQEGGCGTQLWTIAAAVHFSALAAPTGAPATPQTTLLLRLLPSPPAPHRTGGGAAAAAAPLSTGATPSAPLAVDPDATNRPICERYPHLLRGVAHALKAAYCPPNPHGLPLHRLQFTCLGSTTSTGVHATTIPLSRVNDGFCDCPLQRAVGGFAMSPIANGADLPDADGSDEPGTSACALYVDTRHHAPSAAVAATTAASVLSSGRGSAFTCTRSQQTVPASMVDDGLCDCCDGSDELVSPAVPGPEAAVSTRDPKRGSGGSSSSSSPSWCRAVVSNCK